ncbi:MAG: NAD(P)H-binding protein [Candidatus Caenarcaniphilales bacterium]|nr:NAD(P)H-binding protein [Candidatus Caenarcaniphilales bacterium]
MAKKILLIGGTGFIGKSVLKRLVEAGHNVIVLSRKEISSKEENVEYIKGNLLNIDSLVNALNGIEIIIQAAQFPGHPVERPWKGRAYTYEGLDAEGTENVCKAIESAGIKGKLSQYIYLSGAGADMESQYPWTKAKQRAERAIAELGIPYTVYRPSWVYGKGDQSMSKFILFAKYFPFFPVIGNGKAPVNPLWVEDLSQIIFNSIDNENCLNRMINLGSSPEMNMKEVAKTVLRNTGNKKPIICHPKILMKFAGLFAQFIPISPLSPNSVEFLTMDVHLNDLQEEINGVRIKKLEEGLQLSGML